jgi:uncharacterized membrane protein
MGRAGQAVYGVAVAGVGVLCLLSGDLGYVFQPVPRWVPPPLRHGLAYATGALLVAGGLALLARKTSRLAAMVLAVNFGFVWLVLLNLRNALAKPTIVTSWEGCGLNMATATGAVVLLALSGLPPPGPAGGFFGERGVKLARRLFAIGVPLVGLAHFLSGPAAIEYVPTWLPLRVGWVYLTGAGHVAAGLAILVGVVPRLAAVLEAAMITTFVVLTHVPAVWSAPRDRVQWAMLVIAAAIAASAWLVVATFGGGTPFWPQRRRPRRRASRASRRGAW